jgi:hypothetical protein
LGEGENRGLSYGWTAGLDIGEAEVQRQGQGNKLRYYFPQVLIMDSRMAFSVFGQHSIQDSHAINPEAGLCRPSAERQNGRRALGEQQSKLEAATTRSGRPAGGALWN